MATCAACPANLTMENASPERDHIRRRTFRNGKVFGVYFRRLAGRRNNIASRSRDTRAWRGLWCRAGGVARVDNAVNRTPNVVRNIKRTIGSNSQTRGTMYSAFRSFLCSGKTIGENFTSAGRMFACHWLEDYVVAALRIGRPVP